MTIFRPEPNLRRRLAQSTWFVVWLAVTVIAALLTPDSHLHGTHQQLGLPPCPTVLLFDRPCPGCGLTTSWTALVHGNLPLAFHAHPLGPILYLGFTGFAWMTLYGLVKAKLVITDSADASRGILVGFAVFLGFGLVRLAVTPHFGTQYERMLSAFVHAGPAK
jgi:Protein of unknown function (DUF2752)